MDRGIGIARRRIGSGTVLPGGCIPASRTLCAVRRTTLGRFDGLDLNFRLDAAGGLAYVESRTPSVPENASLPASPSTRHDVASNVPSIQFGRGGSHVPDAGCGR